MTCVKAGANGFLIFQEFPACSAICVVLQVSFSRTREEVSHYNYVGIIQG